MSPLFIGNSPVDGMTEGIQQRLEELAREKLAEDEQYFLVDVKVKPKKKLQVFVDGDNGITIDKCAEISRSLEKELDEEGIAGNDYVLEVSSPGMNNPLKVLRQYKRRIGNEVEVVLYTGEKLEGILRSAEENHIALEVPMSKKEKKQAGFKGEATQQRDISFEEIKSTKIKYNI